MKELYQYNFLIIDVKCCMRFRSISHTYNLLYIIECHVTNKNSVKYAIFSHLTYIYYYDLTENT